MIPSLGKEIHTVYHNFITSNDTHNISRLTTLMRPYLVYQNISKRNDPNSSNFGSQLFVNLKRTSGGSDMEIS
jgi:hypothetical protein